MICPVCKGLLKITVKEQRDFVGGDMTLISMICSKCPYRSFDILPSKIHRAKKLTFHIRKQADLNVLVARSSSAIIKIPEIGAEIKPGTASPGFITTVEGILMKFKKYLKTEKAHKLIDELLTGKPFTLLVEDPSGNSSINSLDVEVEQL